MRRLLPIPLVIAVFLFSAAEGRSVEPDKEGVCLPFTKYAHFAVLGKCSDVHDKYDLAYSKWKGFADKGNFHAQYNIGTLHTWPKNFHFDPLGAYIWFGRAANQEFAPAQFAVGELFRLGFFGEGRRQPKSAMKWYRRAADQGDARAQYNLGQMHRLGHDISQNYKEAVKWYSLAAEQGDPAASFYLGLMHYMGQGVPQNREIAGHWFGLAAERGWPAPKYKLWPQWNRDWLRGRQAYEYDNYTTALLEWEPLAEQGDAYVQYMLGFMYQWGQGVPKNGKTALKWYTRSAEQGNLLGLEGAATLHQLGFPFWVGKNGTKIVPENLEKARRYHELAAAQGDPAGQHRLGWMYENGLGGDQNYRTAVKLYRNFAEQGNKFAQYDMGRMYAEGKGVLQDYIKAHMWFNLSASHEYPVDTASKERDKIGKRMTASQLATAQRLARNFVPRKRPPITTKKTSPRSDTDKIISASSGTGFAVSSTGHVITNNHVINGCKMIKIHHKGDAIPATVVTLDPVNDLALLKGNFRPRTTLPLSRKNPQLLQEIYVAGFPFGRKISTSVKVTKGIVSSLTGIGNNISNIQIDAALQPGNSGGPIINDRGNVIGVAVAKLDLKEAIKRWGVVPENTNFGIKSNVVLNLLQSNNVRGPKPNSKAISITKIGKMISDGTFYLSCWMTMAQIEKMKAKKVIFSNLE